MSGLQNFLAPFSHLLFMNRNLDIVVLCFVLFGVAIHALQNYWRASRLERELEAARSNAPMAPAGRRYASAPVVQEAAPQETGGALPPIKGGRTYARNLGSALQKAGINQPIYSPPSPAGWSPQSNPGQPGPGQAPMSPPPYGAPNVPWAATPASPGGAPWGFPGAGGRNNMPGPTPAPFYQPPQPPSQMPAPMPQPSAGPAPNVFAPPSPGGPSFPPAAPATGPFSAPTFAPPPTSGPAAPAPTFTPPVPNPLMQPGMGVPAPMPEAPEADGGRRGKPKRRRFNFNVLENLEKMVQPKAAEPAPTSGWTPPAPPVPTPAQATFSAIPQSPPPAAPAPVSESVAPAPTAPAPTVPALTPAAPIEPAAQAKPAEVAPVPAFLFGKHTPEPETAKPADEAISEPVLDFSAAPAAAADDAAPEAPTGVSDEEGAAPAEAEEPAEAQPTDGRRSMRSMMFGEEASASEPAVAQAPDGSAEPAQVEPAPAEAVVEEPAAETPADDSSTVWPSYPWNRREEASSSGESEPAAEAAVDEHAGSEPAEPDAEASAPDTYEPWQPAEAEAAVVDEVQPVAGDAVHEAAVETPEGPAAADSEKTGAGTIVIIEDDQAAASYYATLFQGNGYHVEVANDGVSGVDLCARMQPQVILLDVMMPRQNGILVLQTLRASDETKNTPVVVMSNFSEPTLIKRAIQLGALEYVIKTQVEGPALLNALPRWMNREKAFAAA